MKRSLITGGCGFVGRHLTRRLLTNGHEVWLLDDLSTGQHPDQWLCGIEKREIFPDGTLRYETSEGAVTFLWENAMVTMLKQLHKLPPAHEAVRFPEFDYVFALASVVGGRKKIEEEPMEVAIDLGIDATFFLWAVCRKDSIGRVLYASSSAAYPVNLQEADGAVPLREDMISFTHGNLGQPDMTYGWSKLTGEYLSLIAARHYGLKVVCVRPFSGYGEDQDLTYPVPAIAFRAARRDNPIHVWGTGRQGRDFVYIEDCITAMLLAIERIEDGSGINIGTGRLTTFIDVARLFVRLAGYEAEVQPMKHKPAGVEARYCEPTLMQHRLGWYPQVSMEEGFARVLDEAHRRIRAGMKLPS